MSETKAISSIAQINETSGGRRRLIAKSPPRDELRIIQLFRLEKTQKTINSNHKLSTANSVQFFCTYSGSLVSTSWYWQSRFLARLNVNTWFYMRRKKLLPVFCATGLIDQLPNCAMADQKFAPGRSKVLLFLSTFYAAPKFKRKDDISITKIKPLSPVIKHLCSNYVSLRLFHKEIFNKHTEMHQ